MTTTYQVVCPDGETRHSAPFATLGAALRWTATGHECALPTFHDLKVTDETDTELTVDYNDAVQAAPAVATSSGFNTIDTIIEAIEQSVLVG